VDEGDLDALMAWAPYKGQSLAERVYRSGIVSDAKVVDAFALLGAKDATAQLLAGTPPPAALGAFTRALAERHRALPLAIEKRRLVVAMLDPSDIPTLERLSFTCGLVVEPRCCRARVLFEGLARAYDIPVLRPEAAFLDSRRAPQPPAAAAPAVDDVGFDLPPPSTDAAAKVFVRHGTAADTSPMARVLREAADVEAGAGIDVDLADENADASSRGLLHHRVRDLRPATTPRVSDDVLYRWRGIVEHDVKRARDSLPPMVLRLLVPPLRSCALFVVRKKIAVGWDAITASGTLVTDAVRDVLVPLTADSVLRTAFETARVAVGQPRDPTTMERTLFRFLRSPPPRSFVALPIVVGDDVSCLMYADRDDGVIDDDSIDELRRVGTALGDALAPFIAIGLLERRPSRKLRPLAPDA